MTVNKTNYYNWQKATAADKVRFGGKPSPNILAIKDYLVKRYGGTSLGIVNKRPIRGGKSLSTHYFGAALDYRYKTRAGGVKAMKELVANSQEWGVQMIVDYVGSVIWTPKNGWRKRPPSSTGMGQAWATYIHIETTKTHWKNRKPLSDR